MYERIWDEHICRVYIVVFLCPLEQRLLIPCWLTISLRTMFCNISPVNILQLKAVETYIYIYIYLYLSIYIYRYRYTYIYIYISKIVPLTNKRVYYYLPIPLSIFRFFCRPDTSCLDGCSADGESISWRKNSCPHRWFMNLQEHV